MKLNRTIKKCDYIWSKIASKLQRLKEDVILRKTVYLWSISLSLFFVLTVQIFLHNTKEIETNTLQSYRNYVIFKSRGQSYVLSKS
jgi:hypothetical protein